MGSKSKKAEAAAAATALAVIEPELVKVDRSLWTVKRVMSKDGKTVLSTKFEPHERFKKQVMELADAIGGVFKTAQQKMTVAINLRAFFEEWKAVTEEGVPAFVNEFFDSTLPKQYGKPNSQERRKLNESSVFNGIRHILENTGKKALQAVKDRENLVAAHIDPNNAELVKAFQGSRRDEKAKAWTDRFVKRMVDFDQKGVESDTIKGLLLAIGKAKTEKGQATNVLTSAGEKILNAAVAGVLKAKGIKVEKPKPETRDGQSELLKKLKASIKSGDNVKARKAATV